MEGRSGDGPENFLIVILLQAGFDDIPGQAGTFTTLGHYPELIADIADRSTVLHSRTDLSIRNTFAKTHVHIGQPPICQTIFM